MNMNDLPGMLLDTLKEHVPPGAEWAPLVAAAVTAAIGLVLMVKGARLAPALAALACAGLGGAAGPFAAPLLGTPLWPTVIASGAIGLILGVVFFRIWLGVLVGAFLMLAATGVYGGQVLREPLNAYLSAGLDREKQLVTLPQADGAVAQRLDWQQEAAGLWSYLGENVPNFQASFYAVVISTGLAGLIFGLLLPKLSRAFGAASLGTVLLALAACAAVQLRWPEEAARLVQWGPLVAGVLWVLSLVYNWLDVHGARPKKRAAAEPKHAAT